MRAPASLLRHRMAAGTTSSSVPPRSTPEQQQTTGPVAMAVDSNMVVILASLLCALVCVLGLALVSRCACRRHRSATSSDSSSSHLAPKGLKKKAIDALPTVSFAVSSPESSTSVATAPAVAWCWTSECAICLTEFEYGESVRVLPGCGHGFHGACVDAWLRTCASCPSCRGPIVAMEHATTQAPAVVVVVAGSSSRCGRCGELAAPAGAGLAGGGDCTFLP